MADTSCASRITGPPTAALSLQTSDDVLTGDLPLAPRSEAPARWVRGMSSVSETLGLHPSFQETHPTLTIWRQFFSESLLGHVRSDADLIGPSSPELVTWSLVPRMSRDIFDRHDQDGAIVISRVEPKDAAKCPTVPRTGDSPARQRIIRPRASAVPRLRTPGPHNADLVFSRGHWDGSTGHDGS